MRVLTVLSLGLGSFCGCSASRSILQPSSPCPSTAQLEALSTWEQIHHTLNTYPIAIDFKNSDLFSCVFATDSFANYTGYLSNLTGMDAIREGLLASVNMLTTQHQLGTTLIEIGQDGIAANSTTYFLATLFSNAPTTSGSYTVLHGLYSDQLTKADAGWRIFRRQLVFMTPNIGNLTLG